MRVILAIIAVSIFASTAQAEWMTSSSGGAFDDKPMNIALTASGSYALGLRCRGDNTEIIYITPERVKGDSTLKLMNISGVKLKVRLDKGAILDFDATAEEIDGKLAVLADVSTSDFKEIRDAKSNISAAIFVLDKPFHEGRFSAAGASKSVSKIIKSCGLN